MNFVKITLAMSLAILLPPFAFSQSQFHLDAYKQFLQQNQDLTATELLERY